MKWLFWAMWALLSLGLGGAALLAVIRDPEWGNLLLLLGLLYYAVLFALMLCEGYRPWGRLGPSRMPELISLSLLPTVAMPLYEAWQVIEQGTYSGTPTGHRLLSYLGPQLLLWLQELLGHWAPALVLLALGVLWGIFLLSLLLRRQ